MRPVLFADDDPKLRGGLIVGIPVATAEELPGQVQRYGISRTLLALPSTSRHRRQRILASLETLTVHVQTFPDIGDLVTGKARVDELREVSVADILGRDQVAPYPRAARFLRPGQVRDGDRRRRFAGAGMVR